MSVSVSFYSALNPPRQAFKACNFAQGSLSNFKNLDQLDQDEVRFSASRAKSDPLVQPDSFDLLGLFLKKNPKRLEKDSLSDLWRDVAEHWADSRPNDELNLNVITPIFKKAIGEVKGLKMLDIGCGEGGFTIDLAKAGADIIGVDKEKRLIEAARHKITTVKQFSRLPSLYDPVFYEGSAANLRKLTSSQRETHGLNNKTFDKVISKMVLMGLSPKDCKAAMEEAYRVLKPGGEFIFVVKHPASYQNEVKKGKYKISRTEEEKEMPVLSWFAKLLDPSNPKLRTPHYTYDIIDYETFLYPIGFRFASVKTVHHAYPDKPPFLLIFHCFKPTQKQSEEMEKKAALFLVELQSIASNLPSKPTLEKGAVISQAEQPVYHFSAKRNPLLAKFIKMVSPNYQGSEAPQTSEADIRWHREGWEEASQKIDSHFKKIAGKAPEDQIYPQWKPEEKPSEQ